MYLPFHLKRCFSFCAVYPKDDKFQKERLAEIWVAEGFVEPQGDTPLRDIGCDYFNDLLNRSFFQEVQCEYLMHDLLHDMAQKVSEHDCFILKRRSDLKNIPPSVRHLSILSSTDMDYPSLLSLCRFTELRTLLCNGPLAENKIPASLMEKWWSELLRLRVFVRATTNELPAAIGNLKHLRYLQISRASPFKSLPDELCRLYNLQILSVDNCKLEILPNDFSNLICLQRFESHGFQCNLRFRSSRVEELYEVSADVANEANDEPGRGFRLMKNINQLGDLKIYNIDKLSKEHAGEAQLQNKKYLEMLKLSWSGLRSPEDNDIEVLRVLQPPTCLKSLLLHDYPGVSLPTWSASRISERINLSEIPEVLVDNNNDITSIFSSLTDLVIVKCQNLSCLEHVVHVLAIKKITVKDCKNLVSVPAERFRDLHCLEELTVQGCPKIYSQSLVSPSLKRLMLGMNDWCVDPSCGNLGENVDCCSLTYFSLSCSRLTSIKLQMWNLPALEELQISRCQFLKSIIGQSGQVLRSTSGSRAFPSLISLTILSCSKLWTIDDLLAEEYLPAIERILIESCGSLWSLPDERFGNISSLRDLRITDCRRLSWKKGFLLPSSLQSLTLNNCGDISAWVPSCLKNLASLVTLRICMCRHITSIPGSLWTTNLTSLENLLIWSCPDIVSIGGENAISEIQNVSIQWCCKMEDLKQPVVRGNLMSVEWS
ncbi:unnamed protein product [Triticum turgidum subsp. durum]|uniref:Uncharacterized protein n=1 Tax=Triticum turgidum subsp. durum TaxID=4567 RepID=A0A9R0ZNS5_TRITD|nr:unnamed protein product [Triticum turgidum subsp. durum]